MSVRGWMLDVMRCIEKVDRADFTLDDMYAFESELAAAHPENNQIKLDNSCKCYVIKATLILSRADIIV